MAIHLVRNEGRLALSSISKPSSTQSTHRSSEWATSHRKTKQRFRGLSKKWRMIPLATVNKQQKSWNIGNRLSYKSKSNEKLIQGCIGIFSKMQKEEQKEKNTRQEAGSQVLQPWWVLCIEKNVKYRIFLGHLYITLLLLP